MSCVFYTYLWMVRIDEEENHEARREHHHDENKKMHKVQKIPNIAYQIYQRLQIYLVYEKDYIKYKYDRK